MRKPTNSSHKLKRSAAPREPKKRPTPALDRAVALLTHMKEIMSAQRLSPRTLRRELRKARDVSPPVWRKAIKRVFGSGVLELPDFRQLTLFGASS